MRPGDCPAKTLPIAQDEVTFVLSPADGATEVSVNYAYKPKFGVLGQIMGSLALVRPSVGMSYYAALPIPQIDNSTLETTCGEYSCR